MSQAWKGTEIKLNNAAAKKTATGTKKQCKKEAQNKSIGEQEWNRTESV